MIYWLIEFVYYVCLTMVMVGTLLALVMLPLMAHKVETPAGHAVRQKEKETLYASVKLAGYGLVGVLLIAAFMQVHILITFQEIFNASTL